MSAADVSHFPRWLVTAIAAEKRVEGIQVIKEQLKVCCRNAGLVILEMTGAVGYRATGRQSLEDWMLCMEVATLPKAV